MTATYVFLGPSLPLDEARELLDAHYLPPVSCGDITDLVLDREPPAAIGIVDGLFEQVPTVWHKEILFALSKGVRVFGASSMGALRAAELHTFGMEGVGGIFEAFRDGRYTDDDEVTIVHAPAEDGYRSLSEAMVNLRHGLAAARDAGHIGAVTHDRLVRAAKETFYPERSWGRVLQDGRSLGLPEAELDALRSFTRGTAPDAKRDDARALLTHMRGTLEAGRPPFTPDFDFEPTFYWEKLLTVVRQQRTEREVSRLLGVSATALIDHLSAVDPGAVDRALGEVLVRQEADRLGVLVPEETRGRHAARHRPPHGAHGDGALTDLLAERDALREVLAKRLQGELAGPVLRSLAETGRLDAVREALAARPVPPSGATVPAAGEEIPADSPRVPEPSGRRE
ncbi:TfuA-like protein [Streptomyces sp. NPDC051569]|uniref:TfuA-like protein n=1 Tax=Streptomyces sp. NPDC051569 TaxID=3365661 RepID=UPI003794B943